MVLDIFLGTWVARCTRHFSTRSFKQPTKEVVHPYINDLENLSLTPRYKTAVTIGRQVYIPKNYRNDVATEATRSGEYLGLDFPYSHTGKDKIWRARKYNVLVNPIPNNISREKCVTYYKRLQVWATHWFENGLHRSRWFKCAYGFNRAKNSAERFRKNLILFGRVDNLKTQDQRRLDLEKLRSIRALRSRRFEVMNSRKF